MATLLEDVIDIVDRLYRLATKIRNPSTRLSTSKALTFKKIDDETGIDLIKQYTKFDTVHMEELFWDYRSVELKDPWEIPEEFRGRERKPGVLTTDERNLLERLAKANTHRRQQFGYWSRHRTKNAKESTKALETVGVTRPKPGPKQGQLPNAGSFNPPPSSKAFSRPTTATQLQNPSAIKIDDGASTMSVRTIPPHAQGAHDKHVEVPEPPSSLKGLRYFSCPYCFTICSQSTLKKDSWR
jgi:hypothetical protein